MSPNFIRRSFNKSRSTICLLGLTAGLWLSHATPSSADIILKFFPDSNSPNATGTLILAGPLDQDGFPLAGSMFDPDGPSGPIVPYDLTRVSDGWFGMHWNGQDGYTLAGDVLSPDGQQLLSAFDDTNFRQLFMLRAPTPPFEGVADFAGYWRVRTHGGVPDIGNTGLQLGMALSALVFLVRRARLTLS